MTALVTMPAGSPVTAIAASGGITTGDHGWIQVAGLKRVSMRQTATLTLQQPGCMAICTSVAHTTASDNWAKPYTSVIGSVAGGTVNLRCASIVSQLATTGVQTCASAIVQLRCL